MYSRPDIRSAKARRIKKKKWRGNVLYITAALNVVEKCESRSLLYEDTTSTTGKVLIGERWYYHIRPTV
jgi:hypothetical protein